MVQTALRSANKTRLLARRLFYSFRQPGAEVLVLTDLAPYFQSHEIAQTAFSLFDKDGNGDVTRDEVEMACLFVLSSVPDECNELIFITLSEVHREQLSIEHSMRDLDSAVGRLDNIFMTLYVFLAALIIGAFVHRQKFILIL